MTEITRRWIRASGAAVLCSTLLLAACGKEEEGTPEPGTLTYWQDVAPIVNAKCVKCHQAGGIGPFALDNYADLKARAPLAANAVKIGKMPPFLITYDGSCGQFDDEDALSASQKATLIAWAEGGLKEGTPVTIAKAARRGLEDGRNYSTPVFAPVAQGGFFAEHDEYRCFLLDPALDKDSFISGYDILPGTPAIVHHVAVSVVDPTKPGADGKPNAESMAALDNADPDRAGWGCLEFAGAGVAIDALPVMWAPGQQPVVLPTGMGVPVKKTDRLVVQIHYNLADPTNKGKTDTTTVRVRFAESVQRRAMSVLGDPFVGSLRAGMPASLPPGEKAAKYSWSSTLKQLGLDGVPYADLIGVMPHMHERGTKYHMRIGAGAADKACVANVDRWDFHWQRLYFYKTPPRITPTSELDLGCEYDTSRERMPVLPGWGTRNEMCSAIMLLALPPSP
jgi:hypothetical protein